MDDYGRYELKYFFPHEQVDALLESVRPHVKADKYAAEQDGMPIYTIRSVYFDSESLRLYHEKIDGLRDRRKFRVRCYGSPRDHSVSFMEIKYRRNRQVMKQRAAMQLMDAQRLLGEKTTPEELALPFAGAKVAERFCYYCRNWELNPMVTVSYERIPFVGMRDERVRLTLDCNLRASDHRGRNALFAPRQEEAVEVPGMVLELKFDRLMPVWMRDVLWKFDIRQQSFSKYAQCIEEIVLNELEDR
jgi:SPX domain protein involved in polyphosphate accumulation